MSDQHETSQRVSVPEAAVLLGLSVATVRRRIRSGQLRAETVHRPQGIAYVVVLGSDHDERSSSDQQVGITAPLNRSPSDAMAVWSATVLAPLVATIERQAETIGTLRATVATLEARTAAQTVEPITEPVRPSWRVWVPWVLTVLAIYAVVALLTVPR